MKKETNSKNLLVGLDIGTSKIVVVVGEIVNGEANIIGFGTAPSRGLKQGVVVNIVATVDAISKAVEAAEQVVGFSINSVFTGIAGSHIRSFNSNGMVAIRDRMEVTQFDVDRVIDAARTVSISGEQKILHILPQEFIIDGQRGILEPVGMSGVRLEAKVHIVTGAISAAQNILECVHRCGLEVEDIVLESLASSYAVLTEDEKELGIALIDIGDGTTDLAIFSGNTIRHSSVLAIAGKQVTNDIAWAFRTSARCAEELKLKHGCAMVDLASPNELIEIPNLGKQGVRKISKQALSEVCEARYEELLKLVLEEINQHDLHRLIPGGIVITGGGSKIAGVVELAERILQMPVRLGVPERVTGLSDFIRNPIYATSVGLLFYGYEQEIQHHRPEVTRSRTGRKKGFSNIFNRMKSWFNFF